MTYVLYSILTDTDIANVSICYNNFNSSQYINNDQKYKLKSYDFSFSYNPHTWCSWEFECNEEARVYVEIGYLVLDLGDYVSFQEYDKLSRDLLVILKTSGEHHARSIISSSNKMTVTFETDAFRETAGFSFMISSVENQTSGTPHQ